MKIKENKTYVTCIWARALFNNIFHFEKITGVVITVDITVVYIC